MNIIKSAKISRFLLKSVRDFNEFHTPRGIAHCACINQMGVVDRLHMRSVIEHSLTRISRLKPSLNRDDFSAI